MDSRCDCQVSSKTTECSHDLADRIRRACASLQMTRTRLVLRICCRWADQCVHMQTPLGHCLRGLCRTSAYSACQPSTACVPDMQRQLQRCSPQEMRGVPMWTRSASS